MSETLQTLYMNSPFFTSTQAAETDCDIAFNATANDSICRNTDAFRPIQGESYPPGLERSGAVRGRKAHDHVSDPSRKVSLSSLHTVVEERE